MNFVQRNDKRDEMMMKEKSLNKLVSQCFTSVYRMQSNSIQIRYDTIRYDAILMLMLMLILMRCDGLQAFYTDIKIVTKLLESNKNIMLKYIHTNTFIDI